MINQRITKLRQLMKERGIDLYIIPTSDFHQSEYVGSYFEARHYMSGFSGSAGTLIVRICRTKDQICRCLIELLQILILFPSDRRQKYDLHLLPEPKYRFFQNCHCNKSTLLEGTLRVWASAALFPVRS